MSTIGIVDPDVRPATPAVTSSHVLRDRIGTTPLPGEASAALGGAPVHASSTASRLRRMGPEGPASPVGTPVRSVS